VTRVYVASSWRNKYQPDVVTKLRVAEYEVYDFRHPEPGNEGFSWAQVEPGYGDWPCDVRAWHRMTSHKIARAAFKLDFDAMKAADACVLVLPAGRSAHLEAGYFASGAGKRLVVLMPESQEPDLMYLMANAVVGTTEEAVACLDSYYKFQRSER
jgi:hypothetical protein